ncbi:MULTISPECIES: GNAT family N-acetyltransferase [unclassified Paracoccus (in: a-proteobacteria)]|uniref:GNAT family N-acetyltransferase n=1 Tax=unclassified Paracoccus (in: a-proteobacteria) TaxID=2688777 RepID=UPI0013524911|nr:MULTISPECIES: GNAT family N-acetyltransferase [unclassified Paracoccus (in: a-proteobacteria)]UXU73899.1 GNAT family N-acetyltransferase [Paracoccus sp. SMMA_5]UXU79787.1 GNAT family N-acetyltransferase [Paracoccus sp. SMMA_5_TC]
MVTLSDTPVLTTPRLVLRAPQAADWPVWRDFARSERAAWVGGPLRAEGQAWRAFGHIIGHWVLRGFGMFTVTERDSGAALGAVGPWFPDGWPEPELGWTLWDPAVEGRGIAQEAALAAREFAARKLGWTTAVSYILPANHRSAALARRLGATPDPAAAHPGTEPCQVWRHPAEAFA